MKTVYFTDDKLIENHSLVDVITVSGLMLCIDESIEIIVNAMHANNTQIIIMLHENSYYNKDHIQAMFPDLKTVNANDLESEFGTKKLYCILKVLAWPWPG